jgi:hypothetical protein
MRDRKHDDNALLTLQQAAARLRMPPDQVRELLQSGRLQPAVVRPLRLRAGDLDSIADGDRPEPSRVRPIRAAIRELRCLACSRTLGLATQEGDRLRVAPPRGSTVVLLVQTESGPRCKRCGGRPYLDEPDTGSIAS